MRFCLRFGELGIDGGPARSTTVIVSRNVPSSLMKRASAAGTSFATAAATSGSGSVAEIWRSSRLLSCVAWIAVSSVDDVPG